MKKETFIKLAHAKYGEAFDYSHLPEFIKRVKGIIICKKHGKIEMIPRDHLRSVHGCPYCAAEYLRKPMLEYNKEMITKAKIKYENKFDYSGVDLNAERSHKVDILCPKHGVFKITMHRHLHTKNGCSACAKDIHATAVRKYDLNVVVQKAKKIHGNVYKYKKYNVSDQTIEYWCSIHGKNVQRVSAHLKGHGCKGCGYKNRTITAKEFLDRAKRVHPKGYKYNLSELNTVNHKITIWHRCGNEYKGRVSNHLSGQGCMRCKSSKGEEKIRKFLEHNQIEYIDQYKIEHSRFRYDFFLPNLNLLIEYDGEQHFRPIKYFGGKKTFERQKHADYCKTVLAKKLGYKLIRISYIEFNYLENYLSRAIDKSFQYRVNGVFYKSFIDVCDALNLSKVVTTRDVEHYRTFKVLSPPSQ